MGIPDLSGTHKQKGLNFQNLMQMLNTKVHAAETKLKKIQSNGEDVSIGDMFEMQMLMNHLSQLSEMSTHLVSANHNCIQSMTRNLKQ